VHRLAALVLALAACSSPSTQNGHSDVDGSVDNPPPTADAPSSSADDPAAPGPATVTMSTAQIPGATSGRTLPATVFVPSSAGPHPLVVVSPGFQMARTQYTTYANHLATWGFVVVLTDYADTSFFPDHQKMADDISAVIDWALAQSSLAVDSQAIGVAGHSLGGKLSIFAATQDARIAAVVGWDPVDSNNPSVAPEKMSSLHAAVAVVGETTDGSGGGMPCAPTADNYHAFYAAAPSPAYAMTVAGADHMDWVDDGSCVTCGFCTAGTLSPDAVHTISRRLDVAWFRRQLLADTTMDTWLAMPPELATNTVTIERH
jgi:predicted dienelactone hydrolase